MNLVDITVWIIFWTILIFLAVGIEMVISFFLGRFGGDMRRISFSWWSGWLMGAAFSYAVMRLSAAVTDVIPR